MKFKSILLFFILCVSCKREESVDKTKTLPFYNSEEFTPEWIHESADAYSEIHTIADFEFTNQNGQKITNQNFIGKIYIADFFLQRAPVFVRFWPKIWVHFRKCIKKMKIFYYYPIQ